MGGRINESNQEINNLQCQVIDMEGKLVKLAALEAAFNHFTNEHWIPLQALVLSLHNSLCWTCRGDGELIPNGVRSALAPPSASLWTKAGHSQSSTPLSCYRQWLLRHPQLLFWLLLQSVLYWKANIPCGARIGWTCMDQRREGSAAGLPLPLHERRGSWCHYSGSWRGR